jgi:hypothetical protein
MQIPASGLEINLREFGKANRPNGARRSQPTEGSSAKVNPRQRHKR